MTKYIASTFALVALIVFIFGTDGQAQTTARVRVNIPFEFYVGKEKLAPGKYEFEPANRQIFPGALIVRSTGESSARSIIVSALAEQPGKGDDGLVIRFNRYGTVHYLSGISFELGSLALRLGASPDERLLAKKFQRSVPVAIRPTYGTGH